MEHQMNGKDQAALTACIPQSLAGGIFIYKADEGETLLYASDYVIGFFGCASYEELADYVHHSFRGMVDLRDRELVEQNIRQQTASDVCQTSYARYRVIACDGTVRYAEHFSRKVTLPGVGEVYYVFIADYDRKYLTSDIDNMTGLPGNRRFLQYVRDLMESGQSLSGYCLVYFNVINFKLVNIRYGVAVGDDCLKGLATMIRETFPQGFLSRRRNDHFQLLTPEGSVREKLETLHESICQVYRKYQLEIKAGVYHFPENQVVDPALAVDYAKIACQHIRDEVGVSVLEYTQDLQKLITVNNYIAGHCDDAIEHGWIQVYYQPVIRTLTGAVCGMEALARWNDPVVGFLSPARFIPILEKNHDIYKLDCYILRRPARPCAAAWISSFPSSRYPSICRVWTFSSATSSRSSKIRSGHMACRGTSSIWKSRRPCWSTIKKSSKRPWDASSRLATKFSWTILAAAIRRSTSSRIMTSISSSWIRISSRRRRTRPVPSSAIPST